MFRRILTYFTILSCLLVGTLVVRLNLKSEVVLVASPSALNYFSTAKIQSSNVESLPIAEIKFARIVFEKPKPAVPLRRATQKVNVFAKSKLTPAKILSPHELPFNEPVQLSPIHFQGPLVKSFAGLYKDLPEARDNQMIAADSENQVNDVVKTSQAKNQEVIEEATEPEFFDYEKEVAQEAALKKESEVASSENPGPPVDLVSGSPNKQDSPIIVSEEVGLEDMVAFDYSKAKQDVTTQSIPTVSTANTISSGSNTPTAFVHKSWKVEGKNKKHSPASALTTQNEDQLMAPPVNNKSADYSKTGDKILPDNAKELSTTVVEALGTNLKGNEVLDGFEVRYHDDYSASSIGSDRVELINTLAHQGMTRSIQLIKRGFITTNTELILEKEGASTSIPLVETSTFNELMSPHEASGPIGAVLVELDDNTELAQLDVPFAKVITLDGDLKETSAEDHRYQLFVGVRAGNALLTYKTMDKKTVTKIIHVHMNELTFDNNLFEDATFKQVKLYEEDLLSKENTPLIIASEQVKIFATEKISTKINDHTFKLDFNQGSLGGRRYLELLHQQEAVFIGVRNKSTVQVPSENFMRHILSATADSKLDNRCLVQVNLSNTALAVEVGAESVDETLRIATQMLDRDGKFYDSISDKTRKIIIMGESHATEGMSPDGKINIKIDYQDGTVEYLSSYCSPNSYMVEQL